MRLTEGGPLETAREEASLGSLPKYWLLPAPTLPCTHSPLSPPQGFAYQVGSLCYYSPVCSVLTMTLCVDWNRSLLHWPVKGRLGKSEWDRGEPKLKQGQSRLLGRASANPTAWWLDHLCLLMGGGFPRWIYKLKPELPDTEKLVAQAPTSDEIIWPCIGMASISLVEIELQKTSVPLITARHFAFLGLRFLICKFRGLN